MRPTLVLTSSWWLASPPTGVWALVADPATWPRWWQSVGAVVHLRSGSGVAGAPVARLASDWRSLTNWPLHLRVYCTVGAPGGMIEAHVGGDLQGGATWLFALGESSGTEVTCRWELHLPRGLAGRLGFVTRLLFERRHFGRMRACALAMGQVLGCRMLPLREWSGALRN